MICGRRYVWATPKALIVFMCLGFPHVPQLSWRVCLRCLPWPGGFLRKRFQVFVFFVLPKELPKSLQAPRQAHVVSAECVKLQVRKSVKRNPMCNIKSLQHAKLNEKNGCIFYINIGSIVRCIFTEVWWTRNHCTNNEFETNDCRKH